MHRDVLPAAVESPRALLPRVLRYRIRKSRYEAVCIVASIYRLRGDPIVDVLHRPAQLSLGDPDGQFDLNVVTIHVTILAPMHRQGCLVWAEDSRGGRC